MIFFRAENIFHPFRAYEHFLWRKYHEKGTWQGLVDTNKKRALELEWRFVFNERLDFDNPKTLNEKIQWLEAFSDTSLWTKYSDKYEVRKYVEDCGFKDCLPRIYGLWERVEDIHFHTLPDSFAIKCTHDCGSTLLIKDKEHFDKQTVVKHLQHYMDTTYGYASCEPHYTKIPHRIIAEELLGQTTESGLAGEDNTTVDYKILCTNGKAQIALVCYDRNIQQHQYVREVYTLDPWESRKDYLAEEYRHQDFKDIPRPENLQQMVDMAERLSEGFPQVRVDLYDINGKLYFGELTFTWACGRILSLSPEAQLLLGQSITLPGIHKKN